MGDHCSLLPDWTHCDQQPQALATTPSPPQRTVSSQTVSPSFLQSTLHAIGLTVPILSRQHHAPHAAKLQG